MRSVRCDSVQSVQPINKMEAQYEYGLQKYVSRVLNENDEAKLNKMNGNNGINKLKNEANSRSSSKKTMNTREAQYEVNKYVLQILNQNDDAKLEKMKKNREKSLAKKEVKGEETIVPGDPKSYDLDKVIQEFEQLDVKNKNKKKK